MYVSMLACVRARACACVCVCISSLQYFDMIKDKNMVYLKLTFTDLIHDMHSLQVTGNLLIVRPLKVLPCYLTVASGQKVSNQRHVNSQHCPDMFGTDVMILRL